MPIRDALCEALIDAAPTVRIKDEPEGRTLLLGDAQLEILSASKTSISPWDWNSPPTFDVIAHSAIQLRIPPDRSGYSGRGHALWFCDARQADHYHWYETAFMINPMIPKSSAMNPFALAPGTDAAKALWAGVAELQLAWPLEPIDMGDLDSFIDRWATWFAAAAHGELRSPHQMPELAVPRNWRQK